MTLCELLSILVISYAIIVGTTVPTGNIYLTRLAGTLTIVNFGMLKQVYRIITKYVGTTALKKLVHNYSWDISDMHVK